MPRFLPSLPMTLPGEQPTGRLVFFKGSDGARAYGWEGGDLVLLSADFLKEDPLVTVEGTSVRVGTLGLTLLRYSWSNDSYIAERNRGSS